MVQLKPTVASALQNNLKRYRAAVDRGYPECFTSGDLVLVAREEFHTGEKLCLIWRGPLSVVIAINYYVYMVEELQNGQLTRVHP